jgi:hypothetical protein
MSAMRFGVLLCLLLTGVAFCTQPAAPAGAASIDLAARDTTAFHRMIANYGGPASYPATRLSSVFDATRVHEPWVKSLENRTWYASDPHPFLASALPGVSLVVVCTGGIRPSWTLCAITSEGRFHRKDDLNSLLLAEGFSLDSTEFETMAKIAVLFEYFMNPPRAETTNPSMWESEYPNNPCGLGAQAFPSIEFRSFSPQQTVIQDAHRPYLTEMKVVCSVNGIAETAKVGFSRVFGARRELDRVVAPHRPGLYFQPGRVTAPLTALQESPSAPGSAAPAKSAHSDLVALGRPARYAATYFHDTTPARPVIRPGVIPESVAMPVFRTWVSSPQQFLAQILPGTKFFRLNVGTSLTMEYWLSFPDGQSFRLDEMTGILAHQGISFDSSNADAAAKLAVLFAYCGAEHISESESTRRIVCSEAYRWDSIAFPSIDFRSFERGHWRSPGGGEFDGIWVDCMVNGSVRRLFVVMDGKWSGKLQPSGVAGPGLTVLFG